jgi:hypothetical protein
MTHKDHPAYWPWIAMRQRCRNTKSKDYARWGARGITVCQRWDSFDAFCADMGPRPLGSSIDRIDPNRGYSPDNCRWATPKQQARNRRDVVRVRTNRGVEDLVDYGQRIGLTKGAVHLRLKRGKLEGAERV